MVFINDYAQNEIDQLIEQYVDYRQKGEYGISSFWYWYYQVKNYIKSLDQYDRPIGDNLVFKMPQWGKIFFSRDITNEGIGVVVTDFDFNQSNFRKWITHKSLEKFPYLEVGDAGYGYKIVQHDDTNKQTLLTPQGKLLTKPIFDNIIGFHHSKDNYNIIHAIGFIGDRVYSISNNGNVTLLYISKEDYLNQKHRYDETSIRLGKIINEVIQKYKREHLLAS